MPWLPNIICSNFHIWVKSKIYYGCIYCYKLIYIQTYSRHAKKMFYIWNPWHSHYHDTPALHCKANSFVLISESGFGLRSTSQLLLLFNNFMFWSYSWHYNLINITANFQSGGTAWLLRKLKRKYDSNCFSYMLTGAFPYSLGTFNPLIVISRQVNNLDFQVSDLSNCWMPNVTGKNRQQQCRATRGGGQQGEQKGTALLKNTSKSIRAINNWASLQEVVFVFAFM